MWAWHWKGCSSSITYQGPNNTIAIYHLLNVCTALSIAHKLIQATSSPRTLLVHKYLYGTIHHQGTIMEEKSPERDIHELAKYKYLEHRFWASEIVTEGGPWRMWSLWKQPRDPWHWNPAETNKGFSTERADTQATAVWICTCNWMLTVCSSPQWRRFLTRNDYQIWRLTSPEQRSDLLVSTAMVTAIIRCSRRRIDKQWL